jgi:hypothetical protein
MAAGLGFKTFNTGDVLSAADTNGYLMQGVLVFASAAARDAAITSPEEGQFAYLKDTNVTTYYTGSAWANLDTTGMTNPMTTTGDTVYSSSGSTPARLGIGSTGQVLTVAGGLPTWATPSAPASGLTLISDTTYSAVSSQSVNSIFSSTYRNYKLFISVTGTTAAQSSLRLRASGTDNSSSNYGQEADFASGSRTTGTSWQLMRIDNGRGGTAVIDMINPFASDNTYFNNQTLGADDTNVDAQYIAGRTTVTDSYDGFTIFPQSGTITGRITVYGYGI